MCTNKTTATTTANGTTTSSINMNVSASNIILLQHVRSLFSRLFIIILLAQCQCTLNVQASVATPSVSTGGSTATATASSIIASSSIRDNNYELHATHSISIDSIIMDLTQLTFEPNFLHFDELSVGETANKLVTIYNRHSNRSVYLGSISGSVSDFYSSNFEEHLVPPMGNTTFNVVFLPRQQAIIQAHLIIHTSFGVLNYEVKGKGVECPYRLSPLIGLKAPMNATLTPEIHMYNPYDTPLQIVEVYSSGGQFQLELPINDVDDDDFSETFSKTERSQALWEIPPYCSKPVIRVRFTATTVGNYTAYIRIKVSAKKNAALEKAVIVLPIEVEIFKENGIYSTMPFLNFGLGGTNDRSKTLTFKLLNSGKEAIDINSYTVEAEQNIKNGITLEMDKVTEPSNGSYHTITTTINWSRISVERYFRGNILIQTRRNAPSSKSNASMYRIPFVGGILRGSIQYNESLTRFHLPIQTSQSTPTEKPTKIASTREFRIKNNFDVALAITNLTITPETRHFFRAEKFKMKLLGPGEEATIFHIIQQPSAAIQSITRSFHLHTNVTVYEIELFSFNGLLKRLLPITEQTRIKAKDIDLLGIDEQSINFGILPLSTLSQTMLALVNQNPIPINIHNWKGTISSAAHVGIIVPGCSKLTMKGLKFCNVVKPGEWIVFQIGVTSNTVGSFEGKFTVQTDYEVISTPINFSTDMGLLKFTTKMIDSETCFPGGVCTVNLTAYSTFTRSMHIKTIEADNICVHTTNDDESNIDSATDTEMRNFDECHILNLSRIHGNNNIINNYNNKNNNKIASKMMSSSYVSYDDDENPVIAANTESYIDQLKIVIPKICDEQCALNAVKSLEDTPNTNRQRFNLLKKQLERFRALAAKYRKFAFHVQTNHIKRYDFNGSIGIIWPKLVKGPIEFPIAQVGHELRKTIHIYNPFDDTLQIYYEIHDAEKMGVDVKLPTEVVDECWNCFLTSDPVFRLENGNGNKNEYEYEYRNEKLKQIVSIPTRGSFQITIKFLTDNPGAYGTLLYIRNNFTVLEAIWLSAKAVVPQFKFGNRKPGSKTPLLFELTDKHLRDCNHPNAKMRAVTSKRTFTAKNSGEVPIYMYNLRIDSMPCEGYGYRIADCMPFELPPNGSKKIEISFTPDFTLAMVRKTLYMDTSLNYSVNYTLLSMIAPLSLGVCSKALARPEWESWMKNVTFIVLATSLVCVLLTAYLDSMKVLKVHVENMSKTKGSLQPALDLRQITLKDLFPEDATKTTGSQSTSGSSAPATSTPISASKQTLLASSCNGKSNGNVCKKKGLDKKRASTVSAENVPTKKSWASEIAKKFTRKKADGKTKTEPVQLNASTKLKGSPPSNTNASNKKDKRLKDDSLVTSLEEEETSSTTTESSNHSDDKSTAAKKKSKKSSQFKDLSNTIPQPKEKKNLVKKSKSLPLNYESPDMENVLSATSSIDKDDANKSNKNDISFDSLSSSNNDESPKFDHTSNDSIVFFGTPPNKAHNMKLMNGKTPGRERTKFNENTPYRKLINSDNQATFKSTAFEFSTPISGGYTLFNFDDNKFSEFSNPSDVLSKTKQQTGLLSNASKSQSSSSKSTKNKPNGTKSKFETKSQDRKNAKLKSLSSECESFECLQMDKKVKKSSPGIDLGPIGTRKSPSSTPVWEPMHSIHNPIPLNLATNPPIILNHLGENRSNSFFTGTFPQTTTPFQCGTNSISEIFNQQQLKQPTDHFRQQLQGSDTLSHLDGMYGGTDIEQQRKQPAWDTPFFLNLLRQQQQHQQQQQQLNQQRLQNMYTSSASSLWNSANMFDTLGSLPRHSYWPASSSSIPNAQQHEVRPPPGFQHTARDQRQLLVQQELISRQYHQQLQQQQLYQLQQQKEQQQQQLQQNRTSSNSESPLQFELFNSIWSSDNSCFNSSSNSENAKKSQ